VINLSILADHQQLTDFESAKKHANLKNVKYMGISHFTQHFILKNGSTYFHTKTDDAAPMCS